MVCNPQSLRWRRRLHFEPVDELAHVAGKCCDFFCSLGELTVISEQMGIVFHGRTASGGVDDYGIETVRRRFFGPRPDVGACTLLRVLLTPHVERQGAATAGPLAHHDFATMASEHADSGQVDLRSQHLLSAPCQERHAHSSRTDCRIGLLGEPRLHRETLRHELHQAPQLRRHYRRQDAHSAGRLQRDPEQGWTWQNPREKCAHGTVCPRAVEIPFNVDTSSVDQVHVVDTHRARRHASEARQAVVEVLNCLWIRRAPSLQHVPYQIDPPARPFVLIATQYVGRTRRRAKAIVVARLNDAVGFCNLRILQLSD